MKNSGNSSTASWVSRRKIFIFVGIMLLTGLILLIKQKYFYRSDLLKPIKVNTKKHLAKINVHIKETKASFWGYFGFGGNENENEGRKALNKWDQWMEDHPELTSVGDIYDKCDNETRTKIGKVVLEANKDKGVSITSYCNQTYSYEVTHITSHMSVYYKDSLLYEKDYDMCEMAPLLDTPYHCPINKGQTVVIRDVANMPSYIPKGRYRVSAYVKDQDGKEIGCTFLEFKTGEVN